MKPVVKIALASMVGTTIEWYDFLLYGTAAALVFNRLFFPSLDPVVGTLAALATFAAGFIARPIGGAIFGHFGDTRGRKSMLFLTLVLMGVTTALIGVLPTYEQVGLLAPVLLVLLRVCQGIGLGGEWGAAVLMAVEHAPAHRRGFFGSWPQIGAPAGLMLANVVYLAVSSTLPEPDFLSWGWRVPFLLSLVLVIVGLFVRRAVAESPEFARLAASHEVSGRPVFEVLRAHPRAVLLAAGSRCAEIGFLNIFTTFLLSYATVSLGMPRSSVLGAIMAVNVVFLFLIPAFGALSDSVGRRAVYLGGAVFGTLAAVPAMLLVDSGSVGLLMFGALIGTLGPAAMFGPQATFFAELFRTRVRYSGSSLGFQLGSVLAGGLSPFVAAALATSYGSLLPVGAFMVGLGFVTVGCVLAMAGRAAGVREAAPVAA